MSQRSRGGSLVFNRKRSIWVFYYWQNGQRRCKKLGTLRQLPTKTAALKAAKPFRDAVESQTFTRITGEQSITVNDLIANYRVEKMPKREDTRRAYEMWFKNHIVPKWGAGALVEIQARPVELWLSTLQLSPKSKSHVRGLLHLLWDFAMWRGDVPVQRNPIELVTVKDATKRRRKPRSLTVEEFQAWLPHLREPYRTIALTCVAFGLRISEALALKWGDIDWLKSQLRVQRGIVCQIVDDVKTVNSDRAMNVAPELLAVLKAWKQTSLFGDQEDWIFASAAKLGRLPVSYTGVLHVFQAAAEAAGIGVIGTHTMRHTYRAWLDAVGTTVAVQQKMMRHADIRTTMNTYGDVVTDEMQQASGKVAKLAVNGIQTAYKPV